LVAEDMRSMVVPVLAMRRMRRSLVEPWRCITLGAAAAAAAGGGCVALLVVRDRRMPAQTHGEKGVGPSSSFFFVRRDPPILPQPYPFIRCGVRVRRLARSLPARRAGRLSS
jgi:hypothetical protein